MTDSFLDNAGGWTPVPDKLVREYGFEVAYVWGRIRRYCQMANGVCTASHETLAKRAGMSRRTLIEKLNILIDAGYIEDKTPDLKNKPHTYCTKIGEAKITSTMQISHTESDNPTETHNPDTSESHLGMRNPHSDDADNAQSDPSTMQNLHSEDAEIAQPTMQNLHLKKDSKETLQETKTKEKIPPKGVGKPTKRESKNPHLSRQMFTVLAKVCKIDLTVLTGKTRGELNQNECALRNGDVIPDDLTGFEAWWYSHDWRGKKGQPPEPSQVIDVWGQFKDWRKEQMQEATTWNPPPDQIPISVPTPDEDIWQRAKDILRMKMLKATYDTVIEGTRLSRKNGHYVVIAPTEKSKAWLENQLAANVKRAVSSVIGSTAEIEFKLKSG